MDTCHALMEPNIIFKKNNGGTSLVIQWLRL